MTINAKRLYFSRLAAEWDAIPRPPEASSRIRRFVERAAHERAHWILDVGCGTGILLPDLLETCRRASYIVELDFAAEMLGENARKAADSRIWRVCANARSLPFPEACFDAILCFGVVPHLGALEAAVRELLRVLSPSGVLSVGHGMGSSELNALHQSIGEPLAHDVLPAAEALAGILASQDMTILAAEESSDWYFVQAARRSS